MTLPTKPAVVALALCALADLAAAAALIGGSVADGPVVAAGVAALVIGLVTAASAVGIARGVRWAVPLALVTRAVDVLAALPGLGAGPVAAAAVVTVVVLSAVAVVLVLRLRRALAG